MPVCEICGPREATLLYRVGNYPIVRCAGCKLVYVDADPSAEELAAYYAADYYRGKAYDDYEEDRSILTANFVRHLDAIERSCAPGRLLDVGCALGFFLQEAQRRGWQATGTDISEYATAYAREQLGVDARTGGLLDLDLPLASFDVVTMWDTIEHLKHPARYLARAAELLRPGGSLFLTTGNVDSLYGRLAGRRWRMIAPPGHLFYFSPATASRMLAGAGLKPVEARTEGRYVSVGALVHALGVGRLVPRAAKRRQFYFDLRDVFMARAVKP